MKNSHNVIAKEHVELLEIFNDFEQSAHSIAKSSQIFEFIATEEASTSFDLVIHGYQLTLEYSSKFKNEAPVIGEINCFIEPKPEERKYLTRLIFDGLGNVTSPGLTHCNLRQKEGTQNILLHCADAVVDANQIDA